MGRAARGRSVSIDLLDQESVYVNLEVINNDIRRFGSDIAFAML
jgi:hypothetical protein